MGIQRRKKASVLYISFPLFLDKEVNYSRSQLSEGRFFSGVASSGICEEQRNFIATFGGPLLSRCRYFRNFTVVCKDSLQQI